ncbi:phosphoenolpyruvate--protein phosphotransferase, partial [Sphingomonas sp.]|uniref:phosphoenolpyruvate--protein phosphotransferase n=1 Tax=Sphingomonas sp. TaxID=28214 RepID=UPI003AFFD57A
MAPIAGWLSTLDEVADPVFGERMMGDGFAIDPIAGELRAPVDAIVAHVAATAHAVTLRLGDGTELLLHVGLDTVALGGAGFDAAVREGQAVRAGELLLSVDLDAVGRAAKDLVTPVVAPGDGVTVRIDRPGRLVAVGEPVAWVSGSSSTRASASGPAATRRIVVAAPDGLHARPAARVVALLRPFAATVTVHRGERSADARSTVALLALGAALGDALEARAQGPDAEAALDALERFAGERFGDSVRTEIVAVTRGPGGVCASPGLAIGRVMQLRPGEVAVAADGAGVAHETAALDAALRAVGAALGRGDLADAHRAMLDDPALRASAQAAIVDGRSAGAGWRAALREASAALEATGDARLAERVADLRDLEGQVLLALTGAAPTMPVLPPDTILIADDLLPSQFLLLDPERLAGICTAAGGPTAHVAILAAAAGVPMIVAAGRGVLDLVDGTTAILDADAVLLHADPDAAALAEASARIAGRRTARAAALRDAATPAATADGRRIEVFANLGSVEDAAAAVRAGAEGCGLLRTEFLFLDRDTAPDEAEQRALYGRIAATLGDRPLIFRTLDIGGDKPVPYLPQPAEANPALGRRGIRLSLARPDLLSTQLRAIVAAVPGAQCRIMLPMVADVAELLAARTALDAAMAAVGRTEPVALGVMIETPAAALIAERLAEHVDFLSVGTNDLTQYTLAADRGNAGVSAMLDAFHPAVLRLIRLAAEGAARHRRWLGVCGGLASDPRATALLIGLGVTELSAVPAAVPAVKAAVRATTLAGAATLAERALAVGSGAAVRA